MQLSDWHINTAVSMLLVPAGIVAAALLPALVFPKLRALFAPFAVGAGMIAAEIGIRHEHGLDLWPVDNTHRLVHLVAIGVVLAWAFAGLERATRFRAAVRVMVPLVLLACSAFAAWALTERRRDSLDPSAWAMLVSISALVLCAHAFQLRSRLRDDGAGARSVLTLSVIAVLSAPILFDLGYASTRSQVVVGYGVALGLVWVAGFVRRGIACVPGIGAAYAFGVPALWLSVHAYDPLPWVSVVFLALAPLAVWVDALPPLRARATWVKYTAQLSVAAVLLAAAALPMAMPATGSDTDGDGSSSEPSGYMY